MAELKSGTFTITLSPEQMKVLWNALYAALDSVSLDHDDLMELRDEVDRQLCEQQFDLD